MSGTEEQLISFFLYSMFIYPVTSYLISSKRSYSRWRGAIYAIIFLAAISTFHMMYENREKGPNHFILLGVTRGTSTANLKRAYRNLSLELHPDKNKSPNAPEEFRKVKQAFDVLLNPDTRQVYERLGDTAVKVSAQSVIDHKYVIIQMLVHYCSSLIFAFLMTFSEATSDAMMTSLFGLIVMLLIEATLVLEQVRIPVWLLPYHTSHDIVSLLHRLYPAFMNGSRCIVGAFVEDHKGRRVQALTELQEASKAVTQKASALIQGTVVMMQNLDHLSPQSAGGLSVANSDGSYSGGSVTMTDALRSVESRTSGLHGGVETHKAIKDVTKKAAILKDPYALRRYENEQAGGSDWVWLRNLAIYLIARVILIKTGGGSKEAAAASGKR